MSSAQTRHSFISLRILNHHKRLVAGKLRIKNWELKVIRRNYHKTMEKWLQFPENSYNQTMRHISKPIFCEQDTISWFTKKQSWYHYNELFINDKLRIESQITKELQLFSREILVDMLLNVIPDPCKSFSCAGNNREKILTFQLQNTP